MKTSFYILLFFLFVQVFPGQAQTAVYRGMVKIKQNKTELNNGVLMFDMNICLSGLSVGRHQTLYLYPVLRSDNDSICLQPIRINGLNKQKMYQRALVFQGKEAANGDAYVILKSDPTLLQEVAYKKEIPYRPWMQHAELVLVGELTNYDDVPVHLYTNVLTDDLNIKDN